jgi:catechol 2,3-dioxygenase-like lactoylglutathione lyase family enzyme
MIPATGHVAIIVQDVYRCFIFCRDLMGLEVIVDFWEKGECINSMQGLSGVRLYMIKLPPGRFHDRADANRARDQEFNL